LSIFTLSLAGLLLLALTVASLTTAASITRHVAPNADCGTATPCYATIQAAIDAAQPGDEIRVAQRQSTTNGEEQRMKKGTNGGRNR
jgi:hypothetical protein